MEGADPDLAAGSKPLEAEPHFVGRLVGERQRQDFLPRNTVDQHPCDAVRNHPRLSASRSGEDQQRAVVMQDGLSLSIGQILQQMFHILKYIASTSFGEWQTETATWVIAEVRQYWYTLRTRATG